ncbi:MAG TPA: biosynthetic-type acetolactate synthase large subunit [Holophaga sp.]|nr:biosynthetic-type acetolactate synthase large subunit [Holophaga sp.]
MEMTGAHIVWECLERKGVDTVFGYPGQNVARLHDALRDHPSIHHVLARHEQGACHMADGYARAGGRPGVVLATSGPGATNLVTGLATAMLDSVPLVAITGQVDSARLASDAFEEVDVTGITLPITKHSYLVRRPGEIAPALREAFALARHGRPGPVLVDITEDAQKAAAPFSWEAAEPTRHLRHVPPAPERAVLDEALALIRAARRPLILAGHGVILSGAVRELLAFAERTATPIATTLLGLGAVPASHPLNLGMMGMHGEAWANQAIQEADLVLAFGMRFDDRVTGDVRTFAAQARKIHVEVDASEIHKNVRVDVPVLADLRAFLLAVLPELEPMAHADWLERTSRLRERAGAEAILADDGGLRAPSIFHELFRATGGRALMVTDVGQNQMWEAQYYKHEMENGLVTSGGLGTMGFALPAALGAKLARPGEEVWVVVGDGGFQMNMRELMTVVQEGLKLNIAVVNNGYLGMVRQLQEFFCGRRYAAVSMASPDFVMLADAYGIPGRRVDRRADVASAIQEARACPGTFLVEFQVEQELSVYPMVPAGASLDRMLRRNGHGADRATA